MSGSTGDRSQQGALGRLRVLQQTIEFVRHMFPSLWQESEIPRMTDERQALGDAHGHMDEPPAVERPELPQAQYYSQSIPIPDAHLRTGARVRQEMPFFGSAPDAWQGRLNEHRAACNDNGEVPLENRFHTEEQREADLTPLNGSGNGPRRRSE